MDSAADEKLIFLISNCKELYDKTHEHFKDTEWKDRLWREICGEIHVDGEDVELVKKRWKNLRDTYLKRKKDAFTKTNVDGKPTKEWKHFKSMGFLDPFLNYNHFPNVTGIYSVVLDEDVTEVECTENEELESTSDVANKKENMPLLSPEANISTSNTSTPRAIPTSILGTKRKALDSSSDQTFEHLKNKKSHKQPEKTTEELFALSLVPALQRMSRQQNALAKMRIQQVLYEVEFGNENGWTEEND